MAKIRINKLALELNIQNDQIIEALQKHDVAVKNHMSSIDEEATQYIRDLFTPKAPEAPTASKNVVKKAKAKIKIKIPSKVTVTTAKTQAKSTAIKKTNKKKAAKVKVETTDKAKTAKKTKETAESKTGKKLGLKIVKKEDKPKPIEKKPAPVAKEKPAAVAKKKTRCSSSSSCSPPSF